ncbi:MAG TPA: thioesterase family protein [Chloroflexota bacterium]|nr:thioesterase family protein [Chloroflexota bacterium]
MSDQHDLVFSFRTPIEVRFRDIDALGHVNNAVYLTYFEIARSAYLQALSGRSFEAREFGIVIAEARCRYRSPAFFGERLIAEVATSSIRSRSFELRYRITSEKDGRLVAEGMTVQVSFDHASGRAAALPPRFRQVVEQFEGRSIAGGHGGAAG